MRLLSSIPVWLRSLRAPFLVASLLPALLGSLAAYDAQGFLLPLRLFVTLVGIAFVHLGANLANDFFDEITGCDRLNLEPTPFSGGSRVIQEGLLSLKVVGLSSLTFYGAGIAMGLWLNEEVGGNLVLARGVIGIACGLLYSCLPFKLSYRGLGELLVFFGFGPLIVEGSYICQRGVFDPYPICLGLPVGLLVLSILLINEILDVHWDGKAQKGTLIVRLGLERGYRLFCLTYLAAYVLIVLDVALIDLKLIAVLSLLPLAFTARYVIFMTMPSSRRALIRLSAMTMMSHALTSSILALSHLA